MNLNAPLDQALSAVEQQLDAVDGAFFAADTGALEREGAALRQASAAFAHTLQRQTASAAALSPVLQRRVRSVAQRLSGQREALARAAVAAERQAACLVPELADAPTYGAAVGRSAGGGAARLYNKAAR
ncbi:hypothetical protein [Xylophilus sp.]|uniref:hypothetical protein n=1 Tax=Xylophilus sp. TaxID=2653893 RepID=UPI0013BA88AD|nr:hypothetical protein [Xylophilus sp.]KAF1044607.1 MAG: hypothetical protein GAK38_03442 [Xylophilus sp.]